MSYRSKNNPPAPPRAFMGHNEQAVKSAIRNMAAEQRWMAVRDITVEDLHQLFIPAVYRHSLQEAFSLASPGYVDQIIELNVPMTDPAHHLVGAQRLLATFRWDHNSCPHGFYVPRDNQGVALQPDISDELRQKWGYVVDNLGRISWEFGLVMKVFESLNQNSLCNTPQQMRFVWPAIRHIVDRAKIGINLAEASARAGDRARVPAEVSDFLVPTVNIVNRTLLIDKIAMEDRECRLGVNAPEFRAGQLLFTGVS
jgi:hypothetical protein